MDLNNMDLNKLFGCVFGVWVVSVILSLGITAGIIYAAIHFIAKYW